MGSLKDYISICANQKLSKVQKANKLMVNQSEDINQLWDEHQSHQELSGNISTNNNFSYLDLKIKLVSLLMKNCILCACRCKINRYKQIGSCGVKDTKIASESLHWGEEPVLVPSHTIFFSGCNLNCVFCQNFDISKNPTIGFKIPEIHMANLIDKRRLEGSKNVNWVGGDPAPHLLYVLKTMQQTRENIPLVWNSNMYLTPEVNEILSGFVDLYLTDFKFGSNKCAERLAGVKNYMEIVGHSHKMAWKRGDMIIRHLIIPGHLECCSYPIMDWINENIGPDVAINIMAQYRPLYQAHKFSEISRPVNKYEITKVIDYAKDIGLRNIIN